MADPSAELTCPDCGSTRLRVFRACGYKKVRCNDCCEVHSLGILPQVSVREEVVMTPYGMQSRKTASPTHTSGATKIMDFERQYTQDKSWDEE